MYGLQSVLLCLHCGIISPTASSTQCKHRQSGYRRWKAHCGISHEHHRCSTNSAYLSTMLDLQGHIFKTSPHSNTNCHKWFYGTNGWFPGLLLDCSKSNKYRTTRRLRKEALKSGVVVAQGKDDLIKWMCPVSVVCFGLVTEENRRKNINGCIAKLWERQRNCFQTGNHRGAVTSSARTVSGCMAVWPVWGGDVIIQALTVWS